MEHAIRAACDVAQDDAVYVFGSQSILGQYPDAPDSLRQSAEADIAPVHAIEMVDLIDASLGELSPFHQAFGFYVHGVPISAAVLPVGWERRAVAVKNRGTNGATGWCLEVHDLAASKLAAFRDKDRAFVRTLLAEDLLNARKLLLRVSQFPPSDRMPNELRSTIARWIEGVVADLRH